MNVVEQHFAVVLSILLFKVVQTFKSVDNVLCNGAVSLKLFCSYNRVENRSARAYIAALFSFVMAAKARKKKRQDGELHPSDRKSPQAIASACKSWRKIF